MSLNIDSLKSVVRDLLSTELAAISERSGTFARTSPQKQNREEIVSLSTNAELQDFVLRLMKIIEDGRNKKEILEGRWVFRLAPGTSVASLPNGHSSVERGLVSERQIEALSAGTRKLKLGPRVVLTPLARDEADRRKIKIERG